MQLTIVKKIGKIEYPFTVEGDNLHEVMIEAEKLSFGNVYKCGVCESEHLYLHAYVTKEGGFKYVKIVCGECRASVTFGQRKEDPDVYFLRKDDNKNLDWQSNKKQSGNNPFFDKCQDLAKENRDKYDTNLYDFGGGKYNSAKEIPDEKRQAFLSMFGEQKSDLPF